MCMCLKRWHTCVLGREKEGGCSGADFSTNQFLRPPPPRLPLLLPCWCSEWPTAPRIELPPSPPPKLPTCSSEWHQDVLRHRDRGVRTQRGPRRVRHVPGAVSFRQYFDTDNNVSGWQALLQSGRSILGLPLYSGRSKTCNLMIVFV